MNFQTTHLSVQRGDERGDVLAALGECRLPIAIIEHDSKQSISKILAKLQTTKISLNIPHLEGQSEADAEHGGQVGQLLQDQYRNLTVFKSYRNPGLLPYSPQ